MFTTLHLYVDIIGTTERPDSLADGLLSYLLTEGSRLPADNIKATEAMWYEDVLDRVNAIHKHTKVTMYTHGDVEKEDSLRLYDEIVNSIQSSQRAAIERMRESEDKTTLGALAVSPTDGAVGLDPALLLKDMTQLIDKPYSSHNAPTATSTSSVGTHKPDFTTMLTPEYEWKSRSRLLTEPHTRVLLPAFNPNDANSALVTYFQVSFIYKTLLNLTNEDAYTVLFML